MDIGGRDSDVEVTEERYFSPHHLLLRVASTSVMEAQGAFVRAREFHILTAMVMSALAVESLCNAVGYRVVPGWKDFEQISAWAKIRLICGALGIKFDKGCAPWQQLQILLTFRNAIAHGKPERVVVKGKFSMSDYKKLIINRFGEPLSKFEKGLTVENARLSVASVRMVENLLTSNLPVDCQMGLLVDAWTHSLS